MNIIRTTIIISLLLVSLVKPVYASWPSVSDASAAPSFRELNEDMRVTKLKSVLENYNSPLAPEAKNFVFYADKYQLDWKLVAAIAGVESIFGKHIPLNSYNAWGWAIYTGKQDGRHFDSWEQGIAVVSEGIKKNYIDKGALTVEQIGRYYAASDAWPHNVRFFINKIDNYNPSSSRAIAIEL